MSTLGHGAGLISHAARARLYGYIYPARNAELLKLMQARKLTVIGEHFDNFPLQHT